MVLFVCVRWNRVGGPSGLSPAYGSRSRSHLERTNTQPIPSRGTTRVDVRPRAPTTRGTTCQSVGLRSGHVLERSLLHLHGGIEAALENTSAGTYKDRKSCGQCQGPVFPFPHTICRRGGHAGQRRDDDRRATGVRQAQAAEEMRLGAPALRGSAPIWRKSHRSGAKPEEDRYLTGDEIPA